MRNEMPQTFSYPYMPMYVHDQTTYMRQMHVWHNQMAQYHEQNRLHHLEMAKHFHQMMGGRVKGDLNLVTVPGVGYKSFSGE
jgi:hypothetical protein